MGVVYKARDLRLERFVAIKILPGDKAADPDSRKRFMREARAASALNHPHIVTIYDIASEGDTDLIVMECVDGCSLEALIPDRGLPLNEADYELAAEHARICVEMQPRSRLCYAGALGALGRVEETRAIWNEVLTVNPYINPADYDVENILAIARTPENTEKHVRGFVKAGIFPKMAAVGA